MMQQALPSSEGLRRAALTLHALAPEDRDWLLQQLPAAHAQALAPLLEELQMLGIPVDRGLVQAALASAAPVTTALVPARAQALCQALLHEAPALQSQLLSLLPPEHAAAVLAAWPADILRPTPAALPASWSPALREALYQAWTAPAGQEARP